MNAPSNDQPSQKVTTDASKAPRHIRIKQQYARLLDKTASELRRLEKRANRAHFLVGEIVLSDPKIWEAVKPIIEPKLKELGTARQVVDDYPETKAQIESLKKLLE